MNQLQKDIKTALSWKQWQPWEKTRHQDQQAFNRLECYIKKDIQIYCKMEMKHIIYWSKYKSFRNVKSNYKEWKCYE